MFDYKEICVKQGYIPSTCKLDGKLCWLLIQEGKNPCDGCNYNREECRGQKNKYDSEMYRMAVAFDNYLEKEREKERQKELHKLREKAERVKIHSENNSKVIMSIIINREFRGKEIEVKINDVINEKGYIKYFDSTNECIDYLPLMIERYGVGQIQIEENGYGKCMYDAAKIKCPNIDIVPIIYTNMRLWH